MKWTIIGNGYIAPRHRRAIEDTDGEVVAIADVNEEKKPKDVAFFTDYKEMLSEVECEGVAICTPNYLHYEMARYALDLGKQVVCEKPLTIQAAKASLLDGVNVMMQLRYHPILETMEVRNGHRYEVKLDVVVKRDESYWTGWKGREPLSGGILYNIGVHYLDMLLLLYGDNYRVKESFLSDRLAFGSIRFPDADVEYKIAITDDTASRRIVIGDTEYQLSKNDNLSSEDLHTVAYREILQGNGIGVGEAVKSLILIEELKKWSKEVPSKLK